MLKKTVNGVEVVCSSEEEAQIRDGWASPEPPDPSDIDNGERALKAVALVMRDYCNQLQAGTYTSKTVSQLRADFKTKFDAL